MWPERVSPDQAAFSALKTILYRWAPALDVVHNEPDRYYNHSCDPNAYLRFVGSRTEVVARRNIAAQTEVTIDYLINNSGGNSWPCHCLASRCRGETGESFFTLPNAIQREYAPLLAPWFVRNHHAEIAALGLACD